jgi:hypothetical protein
MHRPLLRLKQQRFVEDICSQEIRLTSLSTGEQIPTESVINRKSGIEDNEHQ